MTKPTPSKTAMTTTPLRATIKVCSDANADVEDVNDDDDDADADFV